MGTLIEHYAGAFPVWVAPVQVKILTISEEQVEYALEVINQFKMSKIRVEIDDRDEKIGKKIRDAEIEKIPFILVIGGREMSSNSVAVRERGKGDLGSMVLEDFIKKCPPKS